VNVNWLVIPTLLLSLILFGVGQRSIRLCTSFRKKLFLLALWFLLGVPGFLLCLYYLHWFDDAKCFYEFRSFPFTELTAAGSGLFAGGLAEVFSKRKVLSRSFLPTFLCLGIVAPHLKPLFAHLDKEDFFDHWENDVCLQSTRSSCGAASAATVFRALGTPLTERDIARECFTYQGGTENWYIARAFRRRGYQVHYRIEKGFPVDLQVPAIAGLRLGEVGHFIAIIDKVDGFFITGDPLKGRERVAADQMATQFAFTGFFMEISGSD